MMKQLEQMKALLSDVQGYADSVLREAAEVSDRAAKLEPAVREYESWAKKIDDAKAELHELEAMKVQAIDSKKEELSALQSELKRVELAFAQFSALVKR